MGHHRCHFTAGGELRIRLRKLPKPIEFNARLSSRSRRQQRIRQPGWPCCGIALV